MEVKNFLKLQLIFVFFILFSNNTFAFTEQQYENIVNDSILKINENFNITLPSADTLTPRDTTAYNNFLNNLSNYYKFGSYVWNGSTVNDINFSITFFTSAIQEPIYLNNNNRLYETDATTLQFQYSSGQILVFVNNNTYNFYQFFPYANTQNNLYHDFNFYLRNGTTPYEANYEHQEVDSITLNAMHSGDKLSFNNKNQLKVTFTGNYTITDFNYAIQKYNTVSQNWENVTSFLDWYYLGDYNNPFYIYFSYFTYLKVGTYRYIAQYKGENSFSVWSDNFQIVNTVIDNQIVDENGNVIGNVDTGNTVDNLTDFINQETLVTENQFKNNFPQVDVNDPTSDFFTWFFEQIQSCFTVSTSQYLTFTLYNNQFRINSDDYILNIPILKSVIGVGSSIFIFYGIFLDIRKEIEKVKEGKFSEIGKEDITASMM